MLIISNKSCIDLRTHVIWENPSHAAGYICLCLFFTLESVRGISQLFLCVCVYWHNTWVPLNKYKTGSWAGGMFWRWHCSGIPPDALMFHIQQVEVRRNTLVLWWNFHLMKHEANPKETHTHTHKSISSPTGGPVRSKSVGIHRKPFSLIFAMFVCFHMFSQVYCSPTPPQ